MPGTTMLMPSTTRCNPGDVVLVRFPFTDLTSSKKRPALVLSPPQFSTQYGDIVVLALTSQDPADATLALGGWQQAGLPKPTWIKPLLATLSTSIVVRRLGVVAPTDRLRVNAASVAAE